MEMVSFTCQVNECTQSWLIYKKKEANEARQNNSKFGFVVLLVPYNTYILFVLFFLCERTNHTKKHQILFNTEHLYS